MKYIGLRRPFRIIRPRSTDINVTVFTGRDRAAMRALERRRMSRVWRFVSRWFAVPALVPVTLVREGRWAR